MVSKGTRGATINKISWKLQRFSRKPCRLLRSPKRQIRIKSEAIAQCASWGPCTCVLHTRTHSQDIFIRTQTHTYAEKHVNRYTRTHTHIGNNILCTRERESARVRVYGRCSAVMCVCLCVRTHVCCMFERVCVGGRREKKEDISVRKKQRKRDGERKKEWGRKVGREREKKRDLSSETEHASFACSCSARLCITCHSGGKIKAQGGLSFLLMLFSSPFLGASWRPGGQTGSVRPTICRSKLLPNCASYKHEHRNH